MVLIAFDFHQFASIIHIGLDATTSRMASGRRPCASTGDGQSVFFEAPWLAQIGSALTFENLHALSSFSSSAFAISLRFAFQQARSSPKAKRATIDCVRLLSGASHAAFRNPSHAKPRLLCEKDRALRSEEGSLQASNAYISTGT